MSAYRANLINTYKYLETIETEILTHTINMAMTGDLQDINETFEDGEIYSFNVEQLKGSNDVNVKKLINLYMQIEELISSLKNVNNIKDNEL